MVWVEIEKKKQKNVRVKQTTSSAKLLLLLDENWEEISSIYL